MNLKTLTNDDLVNLKPKAEKASYFIKSISNEHKLLVLCSLIAKNRTVSEITDILGMSQPATSQILIKMKECGILDSQKKGQKIYYSIKDDKYIRFFENLCALMEE